MEEVENEWQEKLRTKCTELEDCNRRNSELLEKVLSLSTQQEHSGQKRTALMKAELAVARDIWMRDKLEEISRLRAEIQRENKHKLQAVLEQNIKLRNAEMQEILREKEQEWRSQQEIRFVTPSCLEK